MVRRLRLQGRINTARHLKSIQFHTYRICHGILLCLVKISCCLLCVPHAFLGLDTGRRVSGRNHDPAGSLFVASRHTPCVDASYRRGSRVQRSQLRSICVSISRRNNRGSIQRFCCLAESQSLSVPIISQTPLLFVNRPWCTDSRACARATQDTSRPPEPDFGSEINCAIGPQAWCGDVKLNEAKQPIACAVSPCNATRNNTRTHARAGAHFICCPRETRSPE